MLRASLISLIVPALPCMAGTISLQLPVECTLGQDCYIQNYVDRDPGPGARDAGCGTLTYDGHKGTDFALPTLAGMRAGVAVLAAAPGVVTAIRDGEPDRAFIEGAPVTGRECGNGIVIALGDGWETQYCHLREGSVSVRPGETVAAGQPLGLVGQSGKAAFPHLHLALRHDGAVVDPFDPDPTRACDRGGARDSLWSPPLAYTPSGLLGIGFTTTPPSFEAVKAGVPVDTRLPSSGPALLVWVYGFGAQAGDEIEITIDGPRGEILRHASPVERSQALFYRYSGRKTPPGGWPAGHYRTRAALIRKGETLAVEEAETDVSR
ncbi:M23 family metallopeptidase [Thioclava atlantica]|uniref:M23 family peptidase n=1 Tax=Thioclava atlantica TaxID=1317124 RepID=A0A085TUN3_9RHOB|nr:M23 family metallopeptidase [Thioclava atlantica]KFE34430.1 M23 family peptidase [Thioclava atlantica]